MPERIFRIEPDHAGERLDQFLTGTGLWPSRAFVQKIIGNGGALLRGKTLKAGHKLQPGDDLTVIWAEPRPLAAEPEAIPLDILYEDSDLVVVNKPRGMVVHPAAGNFSGTLVNALLGHCTDLSGIGGVIRPGIVHRLDKDTSGVLVVAKNDLAHLGLAEQIKKRSMRRVYQALVHGSPPPEGRFEGAIGRHARKRKQMAVVPAGKPAATNYRVLEFFRDYALVEARLESGRTHQIRVHFSHRGFPVAGDPLYGFKKEPAPIRGQALHAMTLGFTHPRTGEWLEFSAPLPPEMERVIEWCRKR